MSTLRLVLKQIHLMMKMSHFNKIKKIRDTLLEVCKTNIDVDWNCAEAQDEFSDMYDLINLLFKDLLKDKN